MTNAEKLHEIFPDIPEYSGIDYWGDFWQEEFKWVSPAQEPVNPEPTEE